MLHRSRNRMYKETEMRESFEASSFRREADIMAEARGMQAQHMGRLAGVLVRRFGVLAARFAGGMHSLDGDGPARR